MMFTCFHKRPNENKTWDNYSNLFFYEESIDLTYSLIFTNSLMQMKITRCKNKDIIWLIEFSYTQ